MGEDRENRKEEDKGDIGDFLLTETEQVRI